MISTHKPHHFVKQKYFEWLATRSHDILVKLSLDVFPSFRSYKTGQIILWFQFLQTRDKLHSDHDPIDEANSPFSKKV